MRIAVEAPDYVHYAMALNSIALVQRLSLTNESGRLLENLEVNLTLEDGLAPTLRIRLEALEPGVTHNFERPDLKLDASMLRQQIERVRTELTVEVRAGGDLVSRTSKPVNVLPINQWPGVSGPPELSAAYVLPNDPAIARLLTAARVHLERLIGQPSFRGYQAGHPRQVPAMMEAVYLAAVDANLGYINPLASFETQGQKVRFPSDVLSQGMGTCLDLSLLMAGAFEQIGLNALLMLTDGHAFVAAWRRDQTFCQPMVEEWSRIRKRVELGEIIVVETTLLTQRPPAPFDAAISAARKHLVRQEEFVGAIDIRSARSLKVAPLPVSSDAAERDLPEIEVDALSATVKRTMPSAMPEGEIAPADAAPDLDEETADLAPGHESEQEPEVETGAARMERWKRKLLDLSLRNSMLNFRPGRRAVRLQSHDPGELEDRLAAGDQFQLLTLPNRVASAEGEGAAADERTEAFLRENLGRKRIFTSLSEKELETALLKLWRESRSSIEESGISHLYLAMGFLHWYESPAAGKERLAPLLLIPVELHRDDARSGFRLALREDEPRINITLLEKLRTDFGFRVEGLDEVVADDSGVDVSLILRRFRELIKDQDRWEVRDEAILGVFSFTKFLMWLDLAQRADALMSNRVVRYLVDRPGEPFDDPASFPAPEELDRRYPPEQVLCPRDADSSQLAAIHAANEGKSFVLEGPPGTGKSQTITNLIANCLGQGKRVLFVSEKMAALRVVHRRLTELGLEPFCLELHSHKSTPRGVLEQLQAALEVARQEPPADWDRVCQRLGAMREELNTLVESLHRDRNIGMSVFQATGRLLELDGSPRFELKIEDASRVDSGRLADAREKLAALADAARAVGDVATHPLRALGCEEWRIELRGVLEDAGRRLIETTADLRDAVARAGEAMGLSLDDCDDLDAIDWLVELGELLLQPARPTEHLLREADWKGLRTSLVELIAVGKERDQERERLIGRYEPEIQKQDLMRWRSDLVSARQRWFLPRWLTVRRIRGEIAPFVRPGVELDEEMLVTDLAAWIEVGRADERLSQAPGADAFGSAWNGGRADWAALEAVLTWMDAFRAHLGGKPAALGSIVDDAQVAGLATTQRRRFLPDGQSRSVIHRLIETRSAFDGLLGELKRTLGLDESRLFEARHRRESSADVDQDEARGDGLGSRESIRADGDRRRLTVAATRGEQWIEHAADLGNWCYYRRIRRTAAESGLKPLIAELEAGDVLPEELGEGFERTVLEKWLKAVMDQEEVLRRFNSLEHQRRIEQFQELDQRHLTLSRDQLVATLVRSVPRLYAAPSSGSEVGILKREIMRQRSRMPVRKLLRSIPHLLPRLKPCMLMSPLSVAQFLEPDFELFDLVVFDEASQIPVWDAVGAIARGRETIIVGDSRQLPPTSFFSPVVDDESLDPDEDDVVDLESILEDCVASRLPTMQLLWHYRSRHESLITFSNYHYYANRLHTFPSVVADHPELGVELRYLEEARYDRSKSRTNRQEAQAVVDELVQRLKQASNDEERSIGVVTFSLAQQQLVEDLLDEARRMNPEIESAFSGDLFEPVFVKNLENVQGDERATIIMSVCYGPDAEGRVAMNFGPLNREGGERRLNVAITRARRKVLVFSSLRADQIDLSRTSATGVRHLKTFLDYAQRGPAAIAEAVSLPGQGAFDSPFEKQVYQALVERGWRVDAQVGCSGYRIDLGVRDPALPGRYLLGVECDGAAYHSGKTARDRDRLRHGVLESLGWTLHRIWSRDWWLDPEREIERLDQRLHKLARVSEAASTPSSDESHAAPITATSEPRPFAAAPGSEAVASASSDPEPAQPSEQPNGEAPTDSDGKEEPAIAGREEPSPKPVPPGTFLYQGYEVGSPVGDSRSFYERSAKQRVIDSIMDVVSLEAPLAPSLLIDRLKALWEISRATSRMTERVESLLAELERKGRIAREDGFIWRRGKQPGEYVGFRVPPSPDVRPREIEQIPLVELANAARSILEQQISLPRQELGREVARLFGKQRASDGDIAVIDRAIDHLVAEDRAKVRDDRIAL
ncbi:MAG: DUF3320 domain-containing protein [Phycisphaeraceae bacterium]|nr:DUF3320 domain-containing protein [Phycisphaeraceae bacterium]